MTQRLVILQHAKGEGLGSMRTWFRNHHFQCHTCHVHLGEALPELAEFDWLVVMGGPQSVYEESAYPWLVAEKQLIREAIFAEKKILGVCLGGQLIANALGAEVYANTTSEIGWYPLTRTDAIASWMPEEQAFLSWHNDTFDVPEGATAFAKSFLTRCQGFCYGPRVWALQFHIEAQPGTAEIFLKAGDGTLPEGEWVQPFNQLQSEEHLSASAEAANQLLDLMHAN